LACNPEALCRGIDDAFLSSMADEKRTDEEHEEIEDTTVEINGEEIPRNGPAADGAIGGGGAKGGGVSSYTATGNEKVPPRRPKT